MIPDRSICTLYVYSQIMYKVAVVVGGTGNIGSAVVEAFLEEGSCKHVIITSRSQTKIDKTIQKIKKNQGPSAAAKVIGVVGSTGEEEHAAALKQKVITAVGDTIDYVVTSVGYSHLGYGSLLQVSNKQMKNVFATEFFPSFGAYHTFMPMVKHSGGSYIFVTGGDPDNYSGPGTGVITIASSTATALANVAMKESARDDVCCTTVSFVTGVCPDPEALPAAFAAMPKGWVRSADAGKALVSVATKQKAHTKNIIIKTTSDLEEVIANGFQEG